MLEAFITSCDLDEVEKGPTDQREWFEASRKEGADHLEHIRAAQAGDAARAEDAKKSFKKVQQICNDCHAAYRN